MSNFDLHKPLNRRNALKLGARAAAGIAAAAPFLNSSVYANTFQSGPEAHEKSGLPSNVTGRIEGILAAKGKNTHGIFHIGIDRNDIQGVQLHGTPIHPAFQLNGDLYFQSNSDGSYLMNGDFPLKPEELDPFIHQLIQHDIVFQAEHQHFYDFTPILFFIHFRATGDPVEIAKGMKAALDSTSTPFPQRPPDNPKTSLPAVELGNILGAKPSIAGDGVVNFNVPRAETIRLGGKTANPYLNIAAPIAFQPLGNGNAAAVPDFAMIASEINNVVRVMQHQGWDIGCLYNQETDEHPQLYFSHQFKVGNAIQLAREIRNGLNQTNSKFI